MIHKNILNDIFLITSEFYGHLPPAVERATEHESEHESEHEPGKLEKWRQRFHECGHYVN